MSYLALSLLFTQFIHYIFPLFHSLLVSLFPSLHTFHLFMHIYIRSLILFTSSTFLFKFCVHVINNPEQTQSALWPVLTTVAVFTAGREPQTAYVWDSEFITSVARILGKCLPQPDLGH
jgi:hypothetical protein